MVARNEELVRVWVGVEPGQGVIEFRLCARLSEIACVDENVAFWERRLSAVGVVRVGYAYEADARCVGCARSDRGRSVRRVEPTCEEKEGRRLEVVPGGGVSTIDDCFKAIHCNA